MRYKASMYLTGGIGFALGALVLAASVLLQPVPPETPPLAANSLLLWKATVVGFFIGAALTTTGLFTLARHFAGSDVDGWAMLAFMCGAFGAVGYLAGTGGQWAWYVSGDPIGLSNAMWGFVAIATAGRILAWLSMITASIALTREKAFPTWLPILGMVVGVAEVVAELVLEIGGTLSMTWMVGFAWMLVFGVMMIMARGKLAAAAPEHAAPHAVVL